MARYFPPLIFRRVIGGVVELSVPPVSMSVNYGSSYVSDGCDLKPSMAIRKPIVFLFSRPSNFYTLVMTDLDAPSPSDPSSKGWVHWVVVNIPGGTDSSHGFESMPYMSPNPEVGIHRYVFTLFKQMSAFPTVVPPMSRANFNTHRFAMQFDLGPPVATVSFIAQKEPAKRKRRRRH